VAFDTNLPEEEPSKPLVPTGWETIAQKVLMVAGMAGAFLFVKSLLKKASQRTIAPIFTNPEEEQVADDAITALLSGVPGPDGLPALGSGQQAKEKEEDDLIDWDTLPPEVKRRNKIRLSVQQFVMNHPDDAARLLKAWMAHDN
jgi:flagellar biosynthesis/type III secretory pathway M-ring protein FliF/YscJ